MDRILTDYHKQKLWQDFLSWSHGRDFYEFPLFGQDGIPGISDWVEGLPLFKQYMVLEWVDQLQRSHAFRQESMENSMSRDFMLDKCWKEGYPVSFDNKIPVRVLEVILAKTLDHTMIGYLVADPKVTHIQATLMEKFKDFKPEAIQGLHISLGQIPGPVDEEELQNLLEDVLQYNVSFKVVGVEVFEGTTQPYDYLSLKIHPSTDFIAAYNDLKQSVSIKQMPGGFKSHVSLLKVPKGNLKKGELSVKLSPFPVKPYAIGLWDSSFSIREERPIHAALNNPVFPESRHEASQLIHPLYSHGADTDADKKYQELLAKKKAKDPKYKDLSDLELAEMAGLKSTKAHLALQVGDKLTYRNNPVLPEVRQDASHIIHPLYAEQRSKVEIPGGKEALSRKGFLKFGNALIKKFGDKVALEDDGYIWVFSTDSTEIKKVQDFVNKAFASGAQTVGAKVDFKVGDLITYRNNPVIKFEVKDLGKTPSGLVVYRLKVLEAMKGAPAGFKVGDILAVNEDSMVSYSKIAP